MEIAGDELSMTDVAAAFGRMQGRDVQYRQMPWDEYEKIGGHDLTVMFQWLDRVGYHTDISAIGQELPNLTGFERWLQANWSKAATA
jgi:hypothetical protein